jgi:hypothetical protein
MTPSPPPPLDPTNPLDRGHRRLYRRVGTVIGAALLVAAIVGVVRNEAIGASLQAAWHSPHWDALALLVGAVLATQCSPRPPSRSSCAGTRASASVR